MPVDGALKSRREVTGRSLGTAGRVEGLDVFVEDMIGNAAPGGGGKMNKFLTPTVDLQSTNVIETSIM